MDNDQDDSLDMPIVGAGNATDDIDDADDLADDDKEEELDADGLPLEAADPEADDDEEDE